MTKAKERQLMRWLHGELPPDEARRLERELERGQREQLSAAHQRLVQVWDSLELPPSELPAGFSASVVKAARELCADELYNREVGNGELSWSLAPAWARGGAAAALLTGLLLGAVFGRGFEVTGAGAGIGEEAVIVANADADAVPLSLAEVYWLSLEASEGQLAWDAAEGVQ